MVDTVFCSRDVARVLGIDVGTDESGEQRRFRGRGCGMDGVVEPRRLDHRCLLPRLCCRCADLDPVAVPLYAGSGSHGQHVGTNNVHGGIYQVINVESGMRYGVSGTWSGGIGETGSQPFDVAWFEITVYQGAVGPAEIDAAPGPDDVVIAKREYTGDSIVSFGWEQFTGSFIAQQNQVTLALKTGKVSPNWHPIAAFHDDLSLRQSRVAIPAVGALGTIAFVLLLVAVGLVILIRRSA